MEIYSLLGKKFTCSECGQEHFVETKHIEKGSTEDLPVFLKAIFGEDRKVFLLADNITWEAAGEKCESCIKEGNAVTSLVLHPQGENKVTARESYLKDIQEKARSSDVILTVGTGTVTDLGKITGNVLGKPVVCFPTAPSMNGYTSPVAAYIKDGLKLTVPVRPACGVFIDNKILKDAPVELIKSGFADSLAKSFANADWKISSFVTGENFCPLPYKIVSRSEKTYMEKGDMLLKKDTLTINNLMEGLTLGGISMMLAGKSSPASGGEHMISHFLDMFSHQYRKEIFAYHGLQVGTGVFVSSLLYEEMKDFKADDIRNFLAVTKIDYCRHLQSLLSLFPAGADLIRKEFSEKMRQIMLLREALPEKWEEMKKEAFCMVYGPKKIESVFRKTEIPLHMSELGVGKEIIHDTIMFSRFIRGRLSILDIAGETGILEKFAGQYAAQSIS